MNVPRAPFSVECQRKPCNKEAVIRFVFRWAFRLLVLAIVLIVAALLLKDKVARNYAEHKIRQETGFEARISGLEFSLFSPTLRLENVTLYNPAEFGGGPMLDVPDAQIEYDRSELALGKVHLKLLRLNVRELHLVESASGRTNLIDLLSRVAPDMLTGGDHRKEKAGAFAGIDMLNLSVGKVRYTNIRLPRRNQEISVGLQNEMVRNIKTEQDLTALLFKILLRAGITIYFDRGSPTPTTKRSMRGC
jgi:uncharacterized protein involved in outer membrane biogenesis